MSSFIKNEGFRKTDFTGRVKADCHGRGSEAWLSFNVQVSKLWEKSNFNFVLLSKLTCTPNF